MKNILLGTIWIYQMFFAAIIKSMVGVEESCRFEESCSAYAKRSIIQEGTFKGSYKSIIRILKCQPLVNF